MAPTPDARCDLLVVGGGVNGAGIARDAAGRGLSVVLCEQDDLAQHTSSASTKLIHGGLRYLEQYEFALVRKALQEREVLLAAAPHLVRPLRFVLPHGPHLRPAWLIRAGLFLYDHLAARQRLAGSRRVDLRRHVAGAPLRGGLETAFEYSDAWVDDARLVVANAVDAAARGARVLTRTRCERIERDGDGWLATLVPRDAAAPSHVALRARAVVNATGPWVHEFLERGSPLRARHDVRLVKGSHIVVPKLFDHPYAYLFQNADRRIEFAIPYEREFTLIGTTDVEYHGDAAAVAIDTDEIAYLCAAANRWFRREISPADVVWSYSGVRPLLEDDASAPSSVTRDYRLELDDADGAPLLSVFGGKITTYRRLADEALALLQPRLGTARGAWTAASPLPGGDVPGADFDAWFATLATRHADVAPATLERLARAYGTRAQRILDGGREPARHAVGSRAAADASHLGPEVLPGLHTAELDYLREVEFARTAGDILWRRSKLGLHLPRDAEARLDDWLARHPLTGGSR